MSKLDPDPIFKDQPKWRVSGRDLVRFRVRSRDNFTCQDCGKVWVEGKRHFDVHHLNGLCGEKSRGYDSEKDMCGLITLCHKCHFNQHDWAGRDKLKEKSHLKRNEKIVSMRGSGMSYSQIGKQFNLTRQRIQQIVSRAK